LNEEQKEWAFIKENIYKMKPKKVRQPPINILRSYCHNIIKSKLFKNIMTVLNIINILTFMMYYHRQPNIMEKVLSIKFF